MTAGPHRIRLRGFWERLPSDDGWVRYRRAFGRPRTLDPGERAWLVCEYVTGPATVSVNGRAAGETTVAGPFAFDVTDQLLPRNEAVIETAGDIGEVAVEIRQL